MAVAAISLRADSTAGKAASGDEGEVRYFEGVCAGRILRAERGSGGFGYDALFVPTDGDGRTFAEMDKAEKNVISHRGRALDAFAAWLSAR